MRRPASNFPPPPPLLFHAFLARTNSSAGKATLLDFSESVTDFLRAYVAALPAPRVASFLALLLEAIRRRTVGSIGALCSFLAAFDQGGASVRAMGRELLYQLKETLLVVLPPLNQVGSFFGSSLVVPGSGSLSLLPLPESSVNDCSFFDSQGYDNPRPRARPSPPQTHRSISRDTGGGGGGHCLTTVAVLEGMTIFLERFFFRERARCSVENVRLIFSRKRGASCYGRLFRPLW